MRASPVMKGFTLLEVLIAVSITAMIGVASTQLLSNVIDSKQASEVRSEQLVSLQRFNMVVSRDIEQLINRSIRDEYGDKQASLLLDSGDFPIEFTRAGWRNSPVSRDPRAELQRVAYRLEPIDSDVCEPALQRLQSWGVTEPQYDCLVRYSGPYLIAPVTRYRSRRWCWSRQSDWKLICWCSVSVRPVTISRPKSADATGTPPGRRCKAVAAKKSGRWRSAGG